MGDYRLSPYCLRPRRTGRMQPPDLCPVLNLLLHDTQDEAFEEVVGCLTTM